MATKDLRQTAKKTTTGRKKPGTTGQGNYYHVDIRPTDEFTAFRTQDVGSKGHIQRVAGKRSSGAWATASWRVSKEDAHVEGGKLVGDTKDVRDLIKKLGSEPVRKQGDRFEAKARSKKSAA